MATQLEFRIIGSADFAPLTKQIAGVNAAVDSLNLKLKSLGASLKASEVKALSTALESAAKASGQFTVETVKLSSSAQHLGERIQKNNTTWRDFKFALKDVNDESTLYNKLAQRQVAMSGSLTKVTGDLVTVFTAHRVNMADSAKRSEVFAEALKAQNAVLQQGATKIINWGKNMQWAGRQLTAGLAMPIVMLGSQLAKMYNDVDKNLTNLAKVYGVGLEKPTQAMLDSVRKEVLGLAKELGQTLGISATEVTDIAAQFAAAGMTGKDLIAATSQAARMVVLGETDKQEAIKATIALQTAYKLNTNDLTEAVNFFNAAQAATSTSMADLIEAVPRVGPVVRGLGGSYKDMVAIMTALKEGGVPAGEAANAIKTSMGRLINPTEKSAATLKKFGIDIKGIVSNNAGNLVGMLTTLQQELDSLPSLQRQQAIAELFGKFQFARMAALMDNFNKTGTQSAKVIEMMSMSAGQLADIANDQTKKIQQSASGRFKIAVETLKNDLLPIGEMALTKFTELVDKINGLVNVLQNLPGPIKTAFKAFAIATIFAGPLIMITGLLGNFFGFIVKGLIPLRAFIVALMSGENPLKVLGKSFSLFTEEEFVARNSNKLFAEQALESTNAIDAMSDALQRQIELLQEQERLLSSPKSTPAIVTEATGGGSGEYKSKFFQEQIANAGGTGESSTVGRRTHAFSTLVPTTGAGAYQGSFGDTTLMYKNAKEKKALEEQGRDAGIPDEYIQQLIGDRKKIVLREARISAMQDIAAQLGKEEASELKKLVAEYKKQLAAAKSKTTVEEQELAIKEVNEQYQTRIAGFFKKQVGYQERVTEHQQRISGMFSSGMSEGDIAYQEARRQQLKAQELHARGLNDAQDNLGIAFRATAQKLQTGFTVMLRGVEKGFGRFTRSHDIAAVKIDEAATKHEQSSAELTSSMESEKSAHVADAAATRTDADAHIADAAATEADAAAHAADAAGGGAGEPPLPLTRGQRLKKLFTKKAVRGGIGMGLAVGGNMLADQMGDNNPAKRSLSMAGNLAGIGMMFGPEGAAIGAAAGALIGAFQTLDHAAKQAAAGLRSTMGVTKEELGALGIEVPKLTSSLPEFNNATDQARSAVENFKKAIDDAADTSEMKAFVGKLKEAGADQDKIDSLIKQKATAMALAGVKKEDVQVAIQGYMDSAGLTRTNFDVGSLYGQNGKALPSAGVSAVTGALSSVGMTAGQSAVAPTMAAGRYGQVASVGGKNINEVATSLSAPFEALISTNTDLKDFLNTVQELNNQDFSNTTAGGQALNKTLSNLVADNPQLKSLMDKLKDKTPAEKMIYLRAAVEGVGGSIENLPNMKTIDIQVLLNQKSLGAAASAGDASAINKFNDSLSKSATTGGGGGGGGKSAEDKKIEKLQKQIELIKKQEEERKKLLELQKKELDFEKSKLALQNDLKDALASGNLLKAAEIRQQLSQQEAQKNADDANRQAEDSAQAKIDALQKQIDALQKKKSGSGGGGGGSTGGNKKGQISQADVDAARTNAFNAVNNTFAGSYDAFLGLDAIKNYDKWLKDHKFTADQIAAKNLDLYTSLNPPDSVLKNTTTFKDKYQALLKDIPKGIDPSEYARTAKDATAAALQAARDELKGKQLELQVKTKIMGDKIELRTSTDGKTVRLIAANRLASGGYIKGYAGAGPVSGPGGPKDDLIPAMLSNGEYVLNAASVAKYGIPMLDSINKMNFDGYSIPSAVSTSSSNMSSNNSQSVNATFHISGADAKQVADEAVKKLELMMKRNGSTVRI